jgi:hypothetical protein
MEQTDIAASPLLRATFAGLAAAMLVLWGLSLGPPIQNWGNPREAGFSYVPAFWATLTCLPIGLFLVAGAIVARGRPLGRARRALWLSCILLFLVVAFLIFQQAGDSFGLG